MAYFPFYVDITGQKGVLVGGGHVALEKLQRLLPFAPKLTVIAPEFLPQFGEYSDTATLLNREVCDEDYRGALFVIAATDDEELNRHISAYCREHRILVNVVDDKEKCGFLFPSLIKRGDLTVSVSTGGASPQAAVHLRRQIEELIPAQIEEILDYLAALRPIAKEKIPEQGRRSAFLKEMAERCFKEGTVPSEEETERRMRFYI